MLEIFNNFRFFFSFFFFLITFVRLTTALMSMSRPSTTTEVGKAGLARLNALAASKAVASGTSVVRAMPRLMAEASAWPT